MRAERFRRPRGCVFRLLDRSVSEENCDEVLLDELKLRSDEIEKALRSRKKSHLGSIEGRGGLRSKRIVVGRMESSLMPC